MTELTGWMAERIFDRLASMGCRKARIKGHDVPPDEIDFQNIPLNLLEIKIACVYGGLCVGSDQVGSKPRECPLLINQESLQYIFSHDN